MDLSVKDEAAARASECQVLEPGANWDNVLDGRKGSAFEAALAPSGRPPWSEAGSAETRRATQLNR